MKKYMTLFLFLFVSFAFGQTGPKITAKVDHFDFGTVVEGEMVTHSFEIENSGDANLSIVRVNASCGCTAAKPEKSLLKPGEKTFIHVEFNSEARLGQQQKFIYVFTNDAKTPEFKLSLTGVVVDKNTAFIAKDGKNPKLALDMSRYDFGTVGEGKVVEAKIDFKNEGKAVLKVNDVKTSCGCTAALLSSKTLEPGQKGTLRIELDTSGREGKLVRTVTLYTNDPVDPNQTVTLFVNIEKSKQ